MSPDAWFGVAVAALTALAITLAIAVAAFVHYQRPKSQPSGQVQSGSGHVRENGTGGKAVVTDLEQGDRTKLPGTVENEYPMKGGKDQGPGGVSLALLDTLRGLLEEGITRGLQHEGISERLDRLEQKDVAGVERANMNARVDHLEQSVFGGGPTAAGAGVVPPSSPWPVEATPPAEVAPPSFPEASQLRDAAAFMELPPDARDASSREQREQGLLDDEPFFRDYRTVREGLAFGPTNRQLRLPEPPEVQTRRVDPDSANALSLVTIRRQLYKRESQTRELQRQLLQCQQALSAQSSEASASTKQLKDLMSNPATAAKVQKEELTRLRSQAEDLSRRLAEVKQAETHWASVAKRQRAFFMQNERLAQEGADIARKHPAGELFLAPPPVCLEGDDEDLKNPPWDVGTSYLNPYTIDSWPFEPNVLARRASAEPNLNRLDEEDEEDEDDEDEEDELGDLGELEDDLELTPLENE